jgi:hypothetical protein
MANDPPFATLNHFAADLGIPSESDLLRIGISLGLCLVTGSRPDVYLWVIAGSEGGDLCCRKGLRSKNDLDVKEIVNLWAGKLRGSEVNAGQVLE